MYIFLYNSILDDLLLFEELLLYNQHNLFKELSLLLFLPQL